MLFNSFWARKEIPRLYFFQITGGVSRCSSESGFTGLADGQDKRKGEDTILASGAEGEKPDRCRPYGAIRIYRCEKQTTASVRKVQVGEVCSLV